MTIMTLENINNLSEQGFKQFKKEIDTISAQGAGNSSFFLFGEEWMNGILGATKEFYLYHDNISIHLNRILISKVVDLIEKSTKYREERKKNEALQTELYKQALFGYRQSKEERKQEILDVLENEGMYSSRQKQQVINENVKSNKKEIDILKNEIQNIVRSLKNYQLKEQKVSFEYDWEAVKAKWDRKINWEGMGRQGLKIGNKEINKMKQGENFTGTLDLYEKGLDDEGCRLLGRALVEMTRLQELDLENNYIGDEGCRNLAPALAEMKRLKILNLKNNKFGNEGCRHLAPALAKMKELKTLNLEINNIGDEGCRHLAPALAEMKGLEQLILSDNNIGEEGKTVMREAWKKAGKSNNGLTF